MKTVSVVVPARDEELRLPALFELLAGSADKLFAAAGLELGELLVVDDGSTDGTAAVVERYAVLDPRIRLIQLGRARGKGAAVRLGMLRARGPLALVMDADLATPVDEIVALAAALEAGADVAIGSRGLAQSSILVRQPAYRELAGKTFNRMVRIVTGLPFRDTQCGFKLFRLSTTRELFEQQRIEGFAFDVEVLVRARTQGLDVREVPVRWVNDPQTRVKLVQASARMAFDLIRIVRTARGFRRGRDRASLESGSSSRHRLCN